MQEILLKIAATINAYLSDYILIFLLIGVGLFYSIKTRFVQVRCFGEGMKKVFGNLSLRGEKQKSGMSSFQALATPHAQANVEKPHDQGVVAMIGVFIDTFIVLTLNALVIISTLYTADGPLAGGYTGAVVDVINKNNLAQTAFGSVFGETFGGMFVAVSLLFFAFSTILGWNLFALGGMIVKSMKKSNKL